ncbi:hypothetical protein PLEOSDRAFT_154731 [Pleurotus ostreatus PC15]|uniref:Ribonuclease H1 N-terminal domain-containing protein n=2 Tax=Pleurotus TaxID=5320 RepID=A0A067NPL4_PLEO1|nr:hypothetical protein CCMSSC00406_0007625 [Pleurotus cornucopiae]KDQ30018.1 hypothetical protein PLEOSDRAFT_154731 [Pleurotus ostreatus PC15]
MTNNRGSVGDIDIVALMRRLALAFPEAAAAAAAPTVAAAAAPTVAATAAPAVAAAAAPAVAVPTAAPAFANGQIPLGGVFRCPSCNAVHTLVPAAPPPAPNTPAAPPPALNTPAALPPAPNAPAAPPPDPNMPAAPPRLVRTGHFSAATGIYGRRWYAVVVGRQVGVFQDWQHIVEPLTINVPGWMCKGFSSFADAEAHLLANMHIARIHR